MKVIVHGALGRMGREVMRLVDEGYEGGELACAVDVFSDSADVLSSLDEFRGDADVMIDFSNAAATESVTSYAVRRGIPLVLCTTGQNEAQKAIIADAATKIPVFRSANMSVGVAVFVKMAGEVAKMFPHADIEIIESHHNRKVDAPSGTALMLAERIRDARGEGEFVLGRHGASKRTAGEIGIHAVRGGNIVGIHEVAVITDSQTITLKHEAHSRSLFAEGALTAARFLTSRGAGMYDMYDTIGEL